MGIAIIAKGADFSAKNIGTVTPQSVVNLLGLSISGPSNVEGAEADFSAVYSPSNTSQRGVTWSITSGGTYATINSNTGKLTILSGASNASVTIKATSIANSSITATKTITVTYIRRTYSWNDLLETNQTDRRIDIEPGSEGFIDGYGYPLANGGTSYYGGNISAALGSSPSAVKFFKIPLGSASSIRVPVMKTSGGFGYIFTDSNDIIVGSFVETSDASGTYKNVPIPAGSAYIHIPWSKSVYSALGTSATVTLT